MLQMSRYLIYFYQVFDKVLITKLGRSHHVYEGYSVADRNNLNNATLVSFYIHTVNHNNMLTKLAASFYV